MGSVPCEGTCGGSVPCEGTCERSVPCEGTYAQPDGLAGEEMTSPLVSHGRCLQIRLAVETQHDGGPCGFLPRVLDVVHAVCHTLCGGQPGIHCEPTAVPGEAPLVSRPGKHDGCPLGLPCDCLTGQSSSPVACYSLKDELPQV